MHFLWYNLSRGVTMTKIERLDHQGRGIAYIDDKITFEKAIFAWIITR